MNTLFPHNEIIANILKHKLDIPYEQWEEKIKNPFQAIYKDLNKMVLKISPNLRKAALYRPGKGNSERQCLTQCRWIYDHPKLIIEAQKKLYILVQLADYHYDDRENFIAWGLDWWGSYANSEPLHDLFNKVKGNATLIPPRDSKLGARGAGLRVISRQYTAGQLRGLKEDIKGIIIDDFKKLVCSLNAQFD